MSQNKDQTKAEQIARDIANQLKGGAFSGGTVKVTYGKGKADKPVE